MINRLIQTVIAIAMFASPSQAQPMDIEPIVVVPVPGDKRDRDGDDLEQSRPKRKRVYPIA